MNTIMSISDALTAVTDANRLPFHCTRNIPYSSKFLWLKIFVILADFHDSSLFRDFEV